jgi:pseudouridine-5'-phosphate glycosidase
LFEFKAALEAAAQQGVSGAATTPFVLSYVAQETGGKSLESNIALVLNNAKVGTSISVALAEMRRKALRGE